jgi:hypothetical protein
MVWTGKFAEFDRWVTELRLRNPRRARSLEILLLCLIDDFRDEGETPRLQ